MSSRVCKVDGCSGQTGIKGTARGWCRLHYQRWHRHGTPNPVGIKIYGDVEAQYWAKVDKNGPVPEFAPALGPCWVWTSSLDRTGYGQFRTGGKNFGAHRWGYIRFVADPGPLHLDHLCRVPRCVNPIHLEPVSSKENTRRAWVVALTDQELMAEVKRRGLYPSLNGAERFASAN